MALIYIEKIPEKYRSGFEKKVIDISKKLDIDPNWLMIIMNFESAGLKWDIENSIGCVGLIQFCADSYNVNYKTMGGKRYYLKDIKAMSPIEQLDLVYLYYEPRANKLFSLYDVYLYTFYPYAIGKPDSYVFGSQKSQKEVERIASQNPALDVNKDGKVTMLDYKTFINNLIKTTKIKAEVDTSVKVKKVAKNYWIGAVVGGALAYGMYLAYKHFVVKK